MSKWIVDIHGEIEGDYELIKKYEESEQKSKSEWEYDHEILKAYSDGANEMLDKIRERVELEKLGYPPSAGYYKAIVKVLQIIDEYSEGSDQDERKTESKVLQA